MVSKICGGDKKEANMCVCTREIVHLKWKMMLGTLDLHQLETASPPLIML